MKTVISSSRALLTVPCDSAAYVVAGIGTCRNSQHLCAEAECAVVLAGPGLEMNLVRDGFDHSREEETWATASACVAPRRVDHRMGPRCVTTV